MSRFTRFMKFIGLIGLMLAFAVPAARSVLAQDGGFGKRKKRRGFRGKTLRLKRKKRIKLQIKIKRKKTKRELEEERLKKLAEEQKKKQKKTVWLLQVFHVIQILLWQKLQVTRSHHW